MTRRAWPWPYGADKFEHDQDIFNRLLRTELDGTRSGFELVTGDEGKRSTESGAVEAAGEGQAGEQLQMSRAARGITLGALPLSRFCSAGPYTHCPRAYLGYEAG